MLFSLPCQRVKKLGALFPSFTPVHAPGAESSHPKSSLITSRPFSVTFTLLFSLIRRGKAEESGKGQLSSFSNLSSRQHRRLAGQSRLQALVHSIIQLRITVIAFATAPFEPPVGTGAVDYHPVPVHCYVDRSTGVRGWPVFPSSAWLFKFI